MEFPCKVKCMVPVCDLSYGAIYTAIGFSKWIPDAIILKEFSDHFGFYLYRFTTDHFEDNMKEEIMDFKNFKPGDRIVCIDDKDSFNQLIKGNIYTVLYRIQINQVYLDGVKQWWYAERFQLAEKASPPPPIRIIGSLNSITAERLKAAISIEYPHLTLSCINDELFADVVDHCLISFARGFIVAHP